MSRPVILYLHGFNSSPQSHKARVLGQHIESHQLNVRLIVPRLSFAPTEAITQATAALQSCGQDAAAVIGSSLGGYYAAYLGQRYGLKTVLINPAVRPYELLRDYLGEQRNPYTGETYVLTEQHLDELIALDTTMPARPRQFLVLLQSGDEVLDYRQALAKYSDCQVKLIRGGSHAFDDFEDVVEDIMQFCVGEPDESAAHPGVF